MKSLRHLNSYLFHYKYALILGALFTIISNLFVLFPARFVKRAFDLLQTYLVAHQLIPSESLRTTIQVQLVKGLAIYGGLMLLATVLKGLFNFLARWTIMVTGKRIEYALKNEIYSHYQTLPLAFYRKNSTGDLMARISEDVNQVGIFLGYAIAYGINAATAFLLLLPYMFMVNAQLTLYAALPILLLAVGIYYLSTFMNQHAEAIQHRLAGLTTFTQESFSGIRVLQSFVREATFTKSFAQACDDYKKQSLRLAANKAIFFPAVQAFIGLGVVTVVWVGGQAVLQGKSTLGDMAEFVMYLQLLGWPTFSISWSTYFVQRAAASQKRINEFLQEKNSITSPKALRPAIKGRVAFKNVSFTYPDSGVKALKEVSFEIATGKTVAIIGPTGAGKSTLAHLLCRLYDAEAGTITIDGLPIEDYALSYLRQHLGYVPQDVFLFSDTIQHNIAWGQPGATPAQIAQAAQLAAIKESIQQFPNQMETIIGEKGVTLSGGQKQRLTIARAFIRNPTILVLDDCLSAVDTQTEQRILQVMKEQLQGRTALIISHRLTAAQLADQIVVLEAGKIAEQGTHEGLWARRGLYYALHKQQQQRQET
ncbi:MAG: ABC transporter ATP-binding protein [Roseivirga sp.]